MFWLGILLAIIAIIVTLMKELFEGVKSEDVILHLSIGELVLATLSVITTLSKHLIKHNEVVLTQKHVANYEQRTKNKLMPQRRKVQIILGMSLFLFIGVILTGFLVMHLKDEKDHTYLTYTKFTTVLTLFLSIILDGVINDILSDFHSETKIDQCKLAIHQLNLELSQKLKEQGESQRAAQIQEYLENHDIFSIRNTDHIIFLAPYDDGQHQTTIDDQNNTTKAPLMDDQDANEWV